MQMSRFTVFDVFPVMPFGPCPTPPVLKRKKIMYFSAKFGGIKPRIGCMCRASDRVGGKIIILWYLEANCAGNNMNCTGIM